MATQNININVEQLPEFTCPRCASKYFDKTHILKFLAPLSAGNAKAMIIAQELFACSNCYYVVNQDALDTFKPGQTPQADLRVQRVPQDQNQTVFTKLPGQ